MKRGNYDLIVEQRKSIDHADSIFFKIWGMQKQVYRLEFVAKNFHGVTAFLQDKYLHSSIPVNLNDTTRTDIQINTDPGSYATDRFMIVFKTVGLEKIPFSFSSINTLPDNGNVKINWKTGNENQQGKYVIERSGDGFIFNDLVSINAFNLASNEYEWTDYNPLSGNNFYRIKSTDENGKAIYSKTLKVNGSVINPITVFPNPASVSNFNLKLVNQLPGTYQVQLLNSNARVFMSKKLENISGNNLVKLDINQSVPRGVYHLVITDPSGEKQAIEVVF